MGMAPTFCNRCGDAVEKGCDPREELAELDALMERLRLRRFDLTRKINRFHSPIVRRLPLDIISTIFEFCLPDFTDHQLSPFTKEDISIPLSLGAICSYWRDIAWSTPSLWSSLVVCVPNLCDSRIVTDIALEWLARSGQLPLSICISSTSYNITIPKLADVVNPYSTRWLNLDLFISDYYYQYFHATDNLAPILKSIRLVNPDNGRDLKFQLTCPRLERASLSYFPIYQTNIQWDNLTHLTIHSTSIHELLLILGKTPRLVFCKVSGSCPLFDMDDIGLPVLTSLRSLQLLITSIAAEDFLDDLIAPHLEEFSLQTNRALSIEVITSFLGRSACSLRSFSMIFSTFPPYFESFMSLLQSLPSLNSLSIMPLTNTDEDYDPPNPPNILQLVAKVLSSQSISLQQGFLPNLKILEYTGELHLHPGNFDDLYSLPPADNTVHGPLHLLKLNITQHLTPKTVISYFSSLVERGVTVNVLSDSEDIFKPSIDNNSCREDSLYCDWTDELDSFLSWLPR